MSNFKTGWICSVYAFKRYQRWLLKYVDNEKVRTQTRSNTISKLSSMLFRRSISSRSSLINLTLASWGKISFFFLVSLTSAHKKKMFCRHFECIWTNLIDSWLVDDVPGMSCIAEGAQSFIVAAAGWRDSWRKTNLRINSSGTATNTNNSPCWMTYLQPWWFWSCRPDCLWEARWGQSPCREWSSACARCPTESWTGCPWCSLHPHWAHC